MNRFNRTTNTLLLVSLCLLVVAMGTRFYWPSEPERLLRDWLEGIPREQVTIVDRAEDYATALIRTTGPIPATSPITLGFAQSPMVQCGNRSYQLRANPGTDRAVYDPVGSKYSVILAKTSDERGHDEIIVFVGLRDVDY